MQISVDRGMPWEEAYQKSLTLTGDNDGFYISHKVSSTFCLFITMCHITKTFSQVS